jgi:hypothetical protein
MKIILLPKTTILRNAQSGPHPLLIAEKSEINSQRSITVDITSIGAVHDRAISAALEPSAICIRAISDLWRASAHCRHQVETAESGTKQQDDIRATRGI